MIDLKTGAVTTDLKPTPGVELDYGVRTARGLAGARGTTYTVGINAAGVQTIVVADGRISVILADGRRLSLEPGQISITQTDGSPQTVGSAAALEDAVRAAGELGIDVDPETQSRLDAARGTLAERREQAALESTLGGPGTIQGDQTTTTAPRVIVTDPAGPASGPDPYLAAREAFVATLSSERLLNFNALPETLQRHVVGLNDSDFTAFALDPIGEGETRPGPAIAYVGNLSATNRAAFYQREPEVQDLLVSRPTDASLATYALTSEGEAGLPAPYLVSYCSTLGAGQRLAFRNLLRLA